jgi:hypothetical protein
MIVHPKFGICLDVGSNIDPKRYAPGFSAYADIVVPKPGQAVPPNYHVAPLEDLSCFKDKEFDWVRANHCLEHCQDPDKACAELQRVGKAGIISFPPAYACMMFGRPDHRWLVFVDHRESGDRFLFMEKPIRSLGIKSGVTRCAKTADFVWQDSFQWITVRTKGRR